MSKQALTLQEAADTYGVSKEVIRAHVKAGKLIARYPSSRPVFGIEELREWFESLPAEAPTK